MSVTSLQKHSGNQDYQLGEIRNSRVHIYDTVAHANADSSNANQRFCFITETNRFYMGRSNVWVELETPVNTIVATPDDLPDGQDAGALVIVLSDPAFNSEPNVYVMGSDWVSIRSTQDESPSHRQFVTVSQTINPGPRVYVQLGANVEVTLTLSSSDIAVSGDTVTIKDLHGQLANSPAFIVPDPGGDQLDFSTDPVEMNRPFQCLIIRYFSDVGWVVLSDA